MAGVKSRLKLFEPSSEGDGMAGVPGVKGGVAVTPIAKNVSPALQKFLQKQSEVLDGKGTPAEKTSPAWQNKSPGAPSVFPKTSPVKKEQDENKNVVDTKPDVSRKTSTDSSKVAFKPSDNRRVSVPKAFQQDTASTSDTVKKSNYPTHAIKPNFVPKPAGQKPAVNSKPITPLKPPVKTSPGTDSSPLNKPHIASKQNQPSVTSTNGVEAKTTDTNKKPVSVSNSTTSSTSSSSSASAHEPSSASSEKGVFDFRSSLRPVGSTKTSHPTPVKIQPHESGNSTPENKPTSPKSPVTNGSPSSPTADNSVPSDASLCPGTKKDTPELKRQSSTDIQERKSDQKKFKKIKLDSLPNRAPAPVKPVLPSDVDLTQIQQQYQKTIEKLTAARDASITNVPEEDEVDAIYDEGYSVEARTSTAKRNSERVSLIPDMTAEEEGLDGPLYDEGFTPVSGGSETYVDAETEKKIVEEDDGDLYEDEDCFVKTETEEEKKKRMKEEADAKKKEEKERKEEERKKKKEEKEKAQKEKEELKMRKKFNLTEDTKVGEGVIKQDAKAWKLGLDLSVKKGQIVTIVRLDNNPVNKWLVRSENGMGYVDSSNIEVEPAIIKQIMLRSLLNESCDLEKSLSLLARRDIVSNAMDKGRKNSTTPAADDDDDQPLYDDVPHDVPEESEDDGEIYEEL